MTTFRILHVDDEPDIRALVELSLGLDPELSVCSCASGQEALAAAADWTPDMILCDVMMPMMDGPATLVRLRECPQTHDTPFVFMTARAQTREHERFKALGADGVIDKPFDPMTLARSVRSYLQPSALTELRGNFVNRMRTDAATLTKCSADLSTGPSPLRTFEQIKTIAHGLAGAGGIFGYNEVSNAATTLETTAIDQLAGDGLPGKIEGDIDALLGCIALAELPRARPIHW
jgi:two-component system OmpR family response regulator